MNARRRNEGVGPGSLQRQIELQQGPPRIDPAANPAALRRAAEDFEAFIITQMFEYMIVDVDTDGPFGGGPGERIFRSLLMQEYGAATAKQGGFGIADTIVRQMLATQEVDP